MKIIIVIIFWAISPSPSEMSSFVLVVTAQMRPKHSKLRPAYNSLTLNTVYGETCNLSSALLRVRTYADDLQKEREIKERLVESAQLVPTKTHRPVSRYTCCMPCLASLHTG